MFTVVASLFAVFNISKARRECGEEITPGEEYTKGSIVYVHLHSHCCLGKAEYLERGPLPFECSIKPRSDKARQLVEHAFSAL